MRAILSRADDCGSSHAANQAILEALDAGFVKNVSVMACGEYLEEAAEMLSGRKEICFGLHGCINSEWDRVVWGSVAPREKVPSLIDDRGVFFQSPEKLAAQNPILEEIVTEYKYQLERARNVGFEILYMDSHMFPENFIPGLREAMSRLIKEEGLVDHKWYNKIIPGNDQFASDASLFKQTLSQIEGYNLLVMHPAKYGKEMLLTGNEHFSGETVAQARERDYRFLTNQDYARMCEENKVKLLRYDEAEAIRVRSQDFTKQPG